MAVPELAPIEIPRWDGPLSARDSKEVSLIKIPRWPWTHSWSHHSLETTLVIALGTTGLSPGSLELITAVFTEGTLPVSPAKAYC